jgi:hypothetical protein
VTRRARRRAAAVLLAAALAVPLATATLPLPAHADGGKGGGSGGHGDGGGHGGSGGTGGGGSGSQGGGSGGGSDGGGNEGGQGSGSGDSGKSGSGGDGSGNSGSGSGHSGSGDSGNSGSGNDGSGTDDSTTGDDSSSGGDAATSATAARATTAESRVGEGGGGDRRVVSAELVVADPTPGFGRAVARLGFAVIEQRNLPALGLTVARLRLPPGLTETAGRRLLQQRFPAIIADYNDLYRPTGSLSLPAPDYPRRLIGWGSPDPGCGRGRTIGIVDTAVEAGLPAFAAAAIAQRSFVEAGLAAADPAHGTAVAGILVATRRAGRAGGLLPGAALRVAAIFHRDQAGAPAADALAFALALDWLAAERVEIVNLSLAGADNAVIRLAVERAAARGTLLVAAAGNDGPAAPPAIPAAYPGVLAAAAVDAQRRPDPAGNRGAYIAFAAPGRQVWAASPEGGGYVSGSSFAAPFVAAALAAALEEGESADRATLERRLAERAVDLGAPGRDPVFGWGLIQARAPCSQSAAG